MTKLRPMQEAFVREYLVDLNASAAYRRAGYNTKNANVVAPRLLATVGVQAALASAMKKRADKTEITADRVLQELARLAFGDARAIFSAAGELLPPAQWPDSLASSIAGVEVVTASRGEGVVEHVSKVKFWDKGRALELLARHLGMLNDKLKVEGGTAQTFVLQIER